MKITIRNLMFDSLILLSLSQLITGVVPFINRVLVVIILLCLLYEFILIPRKKNIVVVLLLTIISIVFAILNTENATFTDGYDRGLYFFLLIILYSYFIDDKIAFHKYMDNNVKFVDRVILIWTIVVGISIFVPSCYKVVGEGLAGWGNEKYFFSWTTEGSGRLTSIAILIMSVELYRMIVTKDKKYFWLMAVPLYCALMSGNRSFLAPCLVVFVISLYIYVGKRNFKKMIIPLGFVLCVLLMKSSFGAKLVATSYNAATAVLGKWDTLSNGRFSPIIMSIEYFVRSSLVNKIFGNGFGAVERLVHTWSFNDFIDIGITYGVCGLIPYIACIGQLMKKVKKCGFPFYIKLCVWAGYLIPAMFGLYYRSVAILIAYSLFILSLERYQASNDGLIKKST